MTLEVALPKFGPEPRFEPEPSGPNAKFGSSSGSGSGSRKCLENRFGLNRTSEPWSLLSLYFGHFFWQFTSLKLFQFHNYFSILLWLINPSPGWWPYFGCLSCTCTCWGLLYNIYLAYQTLFMPRLCINNLFLEIGHVFQSVWTRKKFEKYDFKKSPGSEGSNPNRTHGSSSVQVRKFCMRFRFRFGRKGVWTGLNRTSAMLIQLTVLLGLILNF